MGRVIFDIETISKDFDCLPLELQQYLLKDCDTPEDIQKVKDNLSMNLLTAEIAVIAMLNPDTNRGQCYFQGLEPNNFQDDGIEYFCCSEAEILKRFWDNIQRYNCFVTYNGRTFDCPIIHVRSAVHKIKPTRELIPYRYSKANHIDLMDQLSYYSAVRKFSLEAWCITFGIDNPKQQGISGKDVQRLFKEGKYIDIAKYCVSDVIATKELLYIWENYILQST